MVGDIDKKFTSTWLKYRPYFKNMVEYFGASLIPIAISILANPIFASFLSPRDYAIVGFFSSFNPLISPFVIFNVLHYYQKMYFQLGEDKSEELKGQITHSLFYFSLIQAAIAGLGLFLYTAVISPDGDMSFFPYGVLALLPLWFGNFYSFKCVDLKMQRQSRSFLKINILNSVFTVGSSLLLVAVFHFGAAGKMVGALLGPAIMFFIVFKDYKKYLKIPVDKGHFKDMIVFCAPLVLAAMLGFFTNGYDRVCLQKVVPIETLGYYSVGCTIALHLRDFSTAVNNTFAPDIYQSIVQKHYAKMLKIVMVKLALASFVAILFILFSKVLIYLLTAGRYMTSLPYMRIIALVSITSTIYYSLEDIFVASGFTRLMLLNNIIGGACCILIYRLFINVWQAVGASWALVFSYLVLSLAGTAMLGIHRIKPIMAHLKKGRNN